jgi:hypothetical protein
MCMNTGTQASLVSKTHYNNIMLSVSGLLMRIYIHTLVYTCASIYKQTGVFFLLWRCDPTAGHDLLTHEVSRSHTTTHHCQ